jgi:solute carrier family 25 S-adenosylmethionine transporter 26
MKKNYDYYENRRLFFGPIAGIVEAVTMQPLDTIKVLKQSNQYNGVFHHLKEPKNLYKGLTPFTVQMFIKYSLRFSTFELLKSKEDKFFHNFSAGVAAGFIESLFVTPFELVKTNLQTTNNKNPLAVVKNLYQNNGVNGVFKGLYRGFNTTAIRQCTNQSFNFSVYYKIRNSLIDINDKPSLSQIIFATSISSSIGPILTNPVDVLKTRYMNPKYNYGKIGNAFSDIIKNEGVHVLYKGLGIRLFRICGGQIITFSIVENLMYYTRRN